MPAASAIQALCLAVLLYVTPLSAEPAVAQDRAGESMVLELPAQPLDQAVTKLARQAGLTVGGDAALLRGRQAPPLRGEYTPRQAMHALLSGSGITARFTGNATVTLVRADERDGAGPLQLEPITVEGWRPSDSRGYVPGFVSSATKTKSPIVNVPMSVATVTEEVIRDQNARTIDDALRNVAGIGNDGNAGNVSVQEAFTIRGFRSTLIRINGVQRRSTGPLSTANIDSVEVLKGPISVLYGDLSPGGFINVQTKRPQREPAYELTADLSQVTQGRGTQGYGALDLTGPLNDDDTLLYRLVGSLEGGSTFIDDTDREQYFVAPSLSYLSPDDRLRIDLDLSYLRNDETFLFGVPARNGEPDDRIDYDEFLGAEDSVKETEDYTAELRTRYRLTDATRIDAALTYHLNEHFTSALRPGGRQVGVDDTVNRNYNVRSFDTEDLQFEANVIHDFAWEDTTWRVLFGGDVRRTPIDQVGPGFGNLNNFDTINVLDPDNDVELPALDGDAITFFSRADQTTDAWGLYAQAEVWLLDDRLKLLGGVRYSDFEYEFENEAGFSFSESPDSTDPRLAALYKLTPMTSLYLSYSTSFEQTFSFDPDNVDPLEAEQIEAGLKQEFFDGRAQATLALFELTQKNLLTADPNDPTITRQIGEAETRGIEAEFRGRLTPQLSAAASFAYLDNEITEDNFGSEGNRLPDVPEYEASLWLSYDVELKNSAALALFGGIFYEGERFTGTGNSVEMPDHVTVDIGSRYGFNAGDARMSLHAGVQNLFNEEYFIGGFGEGIAYRGQPRTAFVKLGVAF